MVGNAHADAVAPGGERVRDRVAALDDHGYWAGEERPGERDRELGGLRVAERGVDARDAERERVRTLPPF